MKSNQIFFVLAIAGMAMGACSGNNKEKLNSDSSATAAASSDTAGTDTSVKQADSTHSFRNDRGTDSVSAGKSIPAKP
ncbi:MAG TPA: hypothetical protein VGC08_05815 [Pedobacter sp.]